MTRSLLIQSVIACMLLIGVASSFDTTAEPSDEVQQLREELNALRKEVAELRELHLGTLSDEERKALLDAQIEKAYQEAKWLADSRDQTDFFAGIDEDGKIFLSSRDGKYSLRLTGFMQFRYIWNRLSTDNTTGTRPSRSLSGFALNRAQFSFIGKAGDRVGYKFQFATARQIGSTIAPGTAPANGQAAGDVTTLDAYITYDLDDYWRLRAGSARLAFARQELVSVTRQVGVERTLVNEFFTLNRSDHVELAYRDDEFWGRFTLSDGANANFTGPFSDASNDFALTARVDWKADGEDWKIARDEIARADEAGLFLGSAVHYEVAEGTTTTDSTLLWTADALWKTPGYALTAAVFGNHVENVGAADADQFGLYLQGDAVLTKGYNVFARWEMIDDDDFPGIGTEPLQAVTIGVNHNLHPNVRLTADVVYLYAGDNQAPAGPIHGGELSSGQGLSSTGFNAGDSHGDQAAVRLQILLVY